MSVYLSSYRPLAKFPKGLARARAHNIKPFVDASCRREPDFEAKWPSITALCRGKLFAPRLKRDDIVVYISHKGAYLDLDFRHWRLVAVLKVREKPFESHQEAARWYRLNRSPLPSNCMVNGNKPLPVNQTHYAQTGCNVVSNEDRGYQQRAKQCGRFLVCDALYRNLTDPPVITETIMQTVFGRIPGTRNPPKIELDELKDLIKRCGIGEELHIL